MRLTEQQMFDYMYCPAKYDMKHNRHIILAEEMTIPKILNQVCKYFYVYVLNNRKTPTLNQLVNKYESIYKPYCDIISEKKYTEGLFLLRNFYNWACSNTIAVIDSDIKYMITHKNILLEGIMNPVAINKNKKLEFLLMNFSNKIPEQQELDMKIKHTIDIMAFNDSNKDHKIVATKVHHVKSGKDFITGRSQMDYDRLTATMENVAKGIENKIFYPRETPLCNSCAYRHYCRGWNNKEE